jgi:hypothetical protein
MATARKFSRELKLEARVTHHKRDGFENPPRLWLGRRLAGSAVVFLQVFLNVRLEPAHSARADANRLWEFLSVHPFVPVRF